MKPSLMTIDNSLLTFHSANGPTSAFQLISSPFKASTFVPRLSARAAHTSSISSKRPAVVSRLRAVAQVLLSRAVVVRVTSRCTCMLRKNHPPTFTLWLKLTYYPRGPDINDVQAAKELCLDLLANVTEAYHNFKENPPQRNYGGYHDRHHGGGGGGGERGGYGGGYNRRNDYQNQQRRSPAASASPATQASAGGANAASMADYSAQYAQYYGSADPYAANADPYAAYGGYQNYVAYYQYYQAAAAQQQQQAEASAPPPPPASEAPPPPPPGSGSPPPPPPGGGSYSSV